MMNQLRQIYPRILGIERANGRAEQTKRKRKVLEMKDPQKLAEAFFSEMTEEQLTANQRKMARRNVARNHGNGMIKNETEKITT